MVENLVLYIPEIIVGLILLGFAWSFKGWSATLKETSKQILDKLENLSIEFHGHKVQNEGRVSRLEAELESLTKQIDRCLLRKAKGTDKD